ncbi:hypothetical protein ISN45_At01g034450 [Arabidopsis thaliana x Arabidopsis arenosa]|uniref:Transmembrane protein n=2 Tax=Arabidopsis TaxID=3701 RepID=A0A178WIP9_ARATH|nr:hypothetical protein ISN45_At01g034450 [Arabidopsis thaliana x Arabidopsis arenosa]OAP18136.1 hypothetical protein AXX17_AT1G35640 [Arabidopsis thaliana]
MARDSTLGLSYAPRSGESSMVHGATFLWVESFYMFKFETLLFILFALVSEDLITMKLISFPATMSPSPTSFVAAHPPTNVHLSNLQKETRVTANGPDPLLWPISNA